MKRSELRRMVNPESGTSVSSEADPVQIMEMRVGIRLE
jgi:hypothetical protein